MGTLDAKTGVNRADKEVPTHYGSICCLETACAAARQEAASKVALAEAVAPAQGRQLAGRCRAPSQSKTLCWVQLPGLCSAKAS